ncbi:MAG TPA: ATP-dependent DNA helicase RecG [Candidatus Negativibacillus faecipullorum]|nr:ATP-dependent DNA helicase RecG [Candidatus Negativibacillus faecipullorum]
MAISLDTSIQYLTGVGPKRAALYQKLDIHTVRDLLYYFPRSYIDLTAPCDIAAMPLFEQCAVRARVVAKSAPQYIRRGMTLFRVKVADDSGSMVITFFNAKYAVEALKYDTEYIFYGRSGGTLTRREMASPSIYPADLPNALIPVYPLTQGLSSKMVGANIAQALQLLGEELDDPIPAFIRQEYHLCHLQFALRNIHLPTDRESAEIARRRLIFEELLMLALSLRSVRDDTYTQTSYVCGKADLQPFFDQLPFTLTGAQQRAIDQVRQDLAKNTPMNRLVQGDVGSGKTMVAAAASYIAFQNHYMSALMAPTEILAQQHYHGLSKLLEPLGMRLGLLCGSMTAKEKRDIKERIALGMVDLVIGTHALISKDVDLPNLALVVTDEQHRFGVRQRASLSEKSNHPHTLVMSATPIPRTLALMIYGDLDVSSIDELPPNRQPVKTYVISSKIKERAYNFLKDHLDRGLQGYIVCPLVEAMETTPANLQNAEEYADKLARGPFQNYRVGVLHGKMRAKDREAIMQQFASGEIQLLVSTTVIEVGVDVPNAVIMMVENAERFGLSQLHQLRGRVGRGSVQSYCILISDTQNPDTKQRLQVLHQTNDGFKVAEYDLKARGPGDFLGKRQHGLPQLKIADLSSSMDTMEQVQQAAQQIHEHPLSAGEKALLQQRIQHILSTVGTNLN